MSSVEGKELAAALGHLAERRNAILDEVAKAVVGQEEVLALMVAARRGGRQPAALTVPFERGKH